MTILTRHFILLLFIGIVNVTNLRGQEMYPGDVNNNGIANAVDLLYLGVAYGSTGPDRDDDGTDWEAQNISDPWSQLFPNGLNYAYADCDGDGDVDDEDIDDAVIDNFGLQHGDLLSDNYNINGEPTSSPILQLIPNTLIADAGATVIFDLVLGSEEIPVQEFYGLAFTMTYDPELTEDEDEISFELADNSWIDPTNGNLSRSITIFEESGHAEIGISRINQQVITDGAGIIGSFSIVIEDDIASMEIDTLNIAIDSIKLIGLDIEAIPMFPRDTFVLIANEITLSNSTSEEKHSITLFPNPANQYIHFESTSPFDKLMIYNVLGQNVLTKYFSNKRLSQKLNLAARQAPDGMYFLYLETEDGILYRSFLFDAFD